MKTLWRALGIALSILVGWCQVQTVYAQSDPAGRRVLIGFNHLVESENPAALADLIRRAGGEVERAFHLFPVILATLNDETIEQLRNRPDIAYVEEDMLVYAAQETPWGVDRIDAERVWVADYGSNAGAGVDVAILDTGIDADHPDLVIAGGVNCTGNILRDGSTRSTYWDDKEGHGTHCAGVVAARDNDIGVVGVAPEARLWAVKVLADDRSGYISDVIQGIEWCVDSGIEIISMSFTGGFSNALAEACDSAYDAGLLLVGASGNDGTVVGYPAAYDSVIAVSATDVTDGLASFSCTGPEVELAAPGVAVQSTYRDGGFAAISGTSMACPHVAGVAALIWGSPELGITGAAAVRARLRETAEPIASLTAEQIGYGLVDAERAALPPAVVDLAITDVDAAESVVQGDSIDVVVTVQNVGNRDCAAGAVVTLVCDDNADTSIGTTTVGPLSPGASTMLTYTWNTADVSSGSHALTASHDIADDEPSNDNKGISVVVRTPITDVAITAIDAPSSATVEDSIQISVTVENVGDQDVDGDITISLISDHATASDPVDDIMIGTQVIEGGLWAGESETLTYVWDIWGIDAGTHRITARHDVTDEYADNDSDSVGLTISAVAESYNNVTISSIMPRSMWSGMPGSIVVRGSGFANGVEVTFENGNGPRPMASNVRLVGPGVIMGRVTVTGQVWPTASVWDVRVTNLDGSSAIFPDGFTVQP